MELGSIGFIGAGNMANSLIRGLLAQGSGADTLMAADVDTDKLDVLVAECGIQAASQQQIAVSADCILLAVKPQVMAEVCQALDISKRSEAPLVISIAAGITIANLQSWLGQQCPLIRCMPNTPALLGCGASGLFANPHASDSQKALAETILGAVGLSFWVRSEADMDTVTAVSGSGPAYFFLLMECMQDTAREMGLPAELASALVQQTALGAARLAAASDDGAAELRRKVTSPGGTTAAAIDRFEKGQLRELVKEALNAARDRSVELAS